jgi:Zn-dependent protease with chaperone function
MMIAADFFDGRSARRQPATLALHGATLMVATGDAEHPYALGDVRLAEPFDAAPAMLRFADGASCEVAPGAARDALLAALGYRPGRVERWQARWPLAVLAVGLLLALLALVYFRGLPLAADRVAAALPPSVDVKLGRASLAALEQRGVLVPSRLSDQRIAEVQSLLPPLLPAHPRMPVHVIVRDAPQLGANALALPDGTIVVTDGLVRPMLNKQNELGDWSRAALQGVMAHEIGHIEHRHTTRAMASTSLTAALSATLFGDFSAVAAGLPTVLSHLEYSRAMETDADDYAIATMQARRLPLTPLVDTLRWLESNGKNEKNVPRWMRQTFGYLSTHPDTDARIARLRAASKDEADNEDEDEDED